MFKAEIEAILALGGEPEALAALKVGLKSSVAAVRYNACDMLGKLPSNPEIVDLLTSMLLDQDATVRQHAATALGVLKTGLKPAVPSLIIALGDSSSTVRKEAAKTLGIIGPDAAEAVADLIKMVETEKNTSDKDEPVTALGKIGPAAKTAVPVLIQFVTSSDTTLVSACKTALKAITGVDYGADTQKWLAWWEENKNK